ncbi:Uma2 family endonuclease [Cognataquiflexum rubidum]|uniref:Uma2 family endonuclease n=1 Tax=Cognataquiflexum rubidum TaxID=2922273 RepID=UPI001F149194|nr:Uma2 family endonuclease [Cognataquiflexum rubidum]MCH6234914.1 Uma2 family endonuclease [Cognataquiflexum rubidum]
MKITEPKSEALNKVEEPSTEYVVYSYADYLTWEFDEMVELIKGKIFKSAAAAPRRIHQKVSGNIFTKLHVFLKNKPCDVFSAPFDVRLPVKSKRNEDIFTVVQPDISVICDKSKLDDLGCIGAPDLIVEILSLGNNSKELRDKYEVYEESGVKEYWVVLPYEWALLIYTLIDGKYVPSKLFTVGDIVESKCISGFKLDLDEVFDEPD